MSLPPLETSGYHEMYDEEVIDLATDDDLLSKPVNGAHFAANDRRDWRIHRPQKKWARDTDALQSLVQNTRFQCFNVDNNVREFGHNLFRIAVRIPNLNVAQLESS